MARGLLYKIKVTDVRMSILSVITYKVYIDGSSANVFSTHIKLLIKIF